MKRACLAFLLCFQLISGAAASPLSELDLNDGRYVVMLRHALAPGTGDPPSFQLTDCATQRNLNDVGRTQAHQIGEAMRELGLSVAHVYSSQWCRCLETSRLLGYGSPNELPALNSFYGRYEQRDERMKSLQEFLAMQAQTGDPIILVTHQVNISALTGRGIGSGGAELFKLGSNGSIDYVASIPPPK